MVIETEASPAEGKTLHRLLSLVDLDIARILDRALEGKEIGVEEAVALFGARDLELHALCTVANELRKQAVGDIVTYVTVRNINFTNICYTGCRFCAFAKRFGDEEAETLTIDEVACRAEEAWQAGATEVCMQGGLHPKMTGYEYRDIVIAIKERVPDIHIHAYSPFEIQYGCKKTGLSVRDFLLMLKEVGLDTIPGTAAEILDAEIRRTLTKNKLSAESWVEIIKTAHSLGIRSTSTIMYGHVDAPIHWANHLALLRDIQRETGGFTEFVPLGFVHWNAPIYLDGTARPGPTGMEDLRMHAVARIMLNNHIKNIQVSWVKLGQKFAQMCLNAGANDFGGTLMNEKISRSAGAPYGEYMSPEEFQRLVKDMGRIPAQRSTTYELLKVYE
ncbi:MAG: 5-amino-6-(D-ribitylamino)uracil--L-tyrosine 4-hydroxyphenyl transferase CofH [Dehalococcoidia bacterium]